MPSAKGPFCNSVTIQFAHPNYTQDLHSHTHTHKNTHLLVTLRSIVRPVANVGVTFIELLTALICSTFRATSDKRHEHAYTNTQQHTLIGHALFTSPVTIETCSLLAVNVAIMLDSGQPGKRHWALGAFGLIFGACKQGTNCYCCSCSRYLRLFNQLLLLFLFGN